MKVTLFMAMSVNGYIARENGDEDFLSHENWHSFSKAVSQFNNFIIGSKTYEAVKGWDEDYGFDDFVDATKVVVSDNPEYFLDDGYVLASSPENAVKILHEKGHDEALLTGGATNNSSFAKAGLIQKVILNVEPVIIGNGISLFHSDDFQLDLELLKMEKIRNGLLQLHYMVKE